MDVYRRCHLEAGHCEGRQNQVLITVPEVGAAIPVAIMWRLVTGIPGGLVEPAVGMHSISPPYVRADNDDWGAGEHPRLQVGQEWHNLVKANVLQEVSAVNGIQVVDVFWHLQNVDNLIRVNVVPVTVNDVDVVPAIGIELTAANVKLHQTLPRSHNADRQRPASQ